MTLQRLPGYKSSISLVINLRSHLIAYLKNKKLSPALIKDNILKKGYWRSDVFFHVKQWVENEYPGLKPLILLSTDIAWAEWLAKEVKRVEKEPDFSQNHLIPLWTERWKKTPPATKLPNDFFKVLPKGYCEGHAHTEVLAIQESKLSNNPSSRDNPHLVLSEAALDKAFVALLQRDKKEDKFVDDVLEKIVLAQFSPELLSIPQADWGKLESTLQLTTSIVIPYAHENILRAINLFLPKMIEQNAKQPISIHCMASGHATVVKKKPEMKYSFSDANNRTGRIKGIDIKDHELLADLIFAAHSGKDPVAITLQFYGEKSQLTAEISQQFLTRLDLKKLTDWDKARLLCETMRSESVVSFDFWLKQGAAVNVMWGGDLTNLHYAARWGRAQMMRTLLQKGALVTINAKSKRSGRTPLHLAALFGYHEVVNVLLEHGAALDPVLLSHAKKYAGYTPLQIAVCKGHHKVVERLVSAGADLLIKAGDESPLLLAVRLGFIKIAKILINARADMFVKNKEGKIALFIAEQEEMSVMLAKETYYQSIRLKCANKFYECLIEAARSGNLLVLKSMRAASAYFDGYDAHHETALHVAARAGHADVVRFLLRECNVSFASYDAKGLTPLQVAIAAGRCEVINVFIECGANLFTALWGSQNTLFNSANDEVRQLLMAAAKRFAVENPDQMTKVLFETLDRGNDLLKMLLTIGVNPNAYDMCGELPLTRASSTETILVLLENKADLTLRNRHGKTPLAAHARRYHHDAVQVLLQHKADPSDGTVDRDKVGFVQRQAALLKSNLAAATEAMKLTLQNGNEKPVAVLRENYRKAGF